MGLCPMWPFEQQVNVLHVTSSCPTADTQEQALFLSKVSELRLSWYWKIGGHGNLWGHWRSKVGSWEKWLTFMEKPEGTEV